MDPSGFREDRHAPGHLSAGRTQQTIRQQGACKSLGFSRSHADQLIRQLDQLGAAYFHLAEFMRISPDSFRRIAPVVHDDCIEIAGQLVPITSENAPNIKQALLALLPSSASKAAWTPAWRKCPPSSPASSPTLSTS